MTMVASAKKVLFEKDFKLEVKNPMLAGNPLISEDGRVAQIDIDCNCHSDRICGG